MISLQVIPEPGTEIIAQLRALLRAAEVVDHSSAFSDQAVLAVQQGTRTLLSIPHPTDPQHERVGFAALGAGELDLVVHPAARGAGIGTATLAELLALAPQLTATPTVLAWSHGTQPAPRALLRRAGFHGIRTLYKMELDPAQLPRAISQARAVPQGVRIDTFDPHTPAHTDAWVRINGAAFADHPEQGAVTRAEFTALTHEPWFRATHLCFAVRPEAPPETQYAGFAWVKTLTDAHPNGPETELYVLGVHPDAAGTGIGAALFGVALQRMAEVHPAGVSLYVDAENTHAVALYERAGFTVAAQSTQWERSLTVS